MHALLVFTKKEWTEGMRSGKLIMLAAGFIFFGILNPATAKLLPVLLESMAGSFAEIGMSVSAIQVDAMTSWEQFFKNLPMVLAAFVLVFSNLFSKEYQTGALVLLLTRGLPRYVVVVAKALFLLACWTAGFWLSFGITYAYNSFLWGNTGFPAAAALPWYGFSLLILCVMVLFSVLQRSSGTVLLETGLFVVLCYLLSLFPRVKRFSPVFLTESLPVLKEGALLPEYAPALVISAVIGVVCLAAGTCAMSRKQL